MRLRSKFLAGMMLALAGASCAGGWSHHTYQAKPSGALLELDWTHKWEPVQVFVIKSCQVRFESLTLLLEPKLGNDLVIDGRTVAGTYRHGAMAECSEPHRVTGTVRLLDNGPEIVRARLDAIGHCPDSEPVALKGEFSFEARPASNP